MNPSNLSRRLLRVAQGIENSKTPSKALVARELRTILAQLSQDSDDTEKGLHATIGDLESTAMGHAKEFREAFDSNEYDHAAAKASDVAGVWGHIEEMMGKLGHHKKGGSEGQD